MNIFLIDAVRWINYAFLFAVVASIFITLVDEVPYISDIHRYLFIVYLSLFIFVSKQKYIRLSPFFLIFLFLVTVVVNQRLAIISFDTLYSVRLYRIEIPQDLITEYILVFFGYLLLLSVVIFWLGVLLKGFFPPSFLDNVKNRGLRVAVLSLLFLCSANWEIFNYANGGFLGGQSNVQNSFLQRYVLSILKPDVFFYLALALLLSGTEQFKRQSNWIVFALILFFLIWKMVTGGKDGLFMLTIFYFSFISFFRLDEKLKVSFARVLGIGVLALSALGSFLYIDVFRVLLWAGGSLSDIPDLVSRLESDQALRSLIGTLSNRLAIFDESLFSLYLYELGYSNIDHLVNFDATIKLVVDVIVPSTLFPDLIRPQYALAIAQGFDPEYNAMGLEVMTGFVWGYVGFFGFLFGKPLGAVVAACWALGALLYFCFLAKFIFPRTLASYFLLYHIPVWLYLFLAMMGLEHSASWFVHIPIINLINYLLFAVIYSFLLGLLRTKGARYGG